MLSWLHLPATCNLLANKRYGDASFPFCVETAHNNRVTLRLCNKDTRNYWFLWIFQRASLTSLFYCRYAARNLTHDIVVRCPIARAVPCLRVVSSHQDESGLHRVSEIDFWINTLRASHTCCKLTRGCGQRLTKGDFQGSTCMDLQRITLFRSNWSHANFSIS